MAMQDIEVAELDRAASRSDELVAAIRQRGGDLTPAFEVLEESLRTFEKSGYPLDAIVPASSEGALGFSSIGQANGRDFWRKYSRLVKKDLCEANGELHTLVKSGLAGASGAVISAIVASLSLPMAALPVVVPIAAILVTKGVEAFCLETSSDS